MILDFIKRLFNSDKVSGTKEGTVKFFNAKKGFGFIIINDTKYTYQFKTGFVKKDMRFKTWFFTEEDLTKLICLHELKIIEKLKQNGFV